jgi:ribosome-binding protein aMBF1 (putative translation factor)
VRRGALSIVLAIMVAALLAGCSGVRMVYDNVDTFIRWRALQFLDVHDAQADELDERIARFLRWHRANALPKYARDADEAARRLADGLSQDDLVWGYDSAVAHARESLRVAAEQLAPLLDRLDAEQIRHMEQRIAEENRKFARENLRGSERERRERRAQRIVTRLEEWVGNLSKAQLDRVNQYSARAPLIEEMRDRDNKRLQGEVLAIIRAHEARKRLPERMAYWERGRDPAFAAARAANQQEFYQMLLDLDRLGTPEQRAQLAAEVRRYAGEFRALAARRGSS